MNPAWQIDVYRQIEGGQFVITDGDHIFSPVGPFASYDEAVTEYRRNQPQGMEWLNQPTIRLLLRPIGVRDGV